MHQQARKLIKRGIFDNVVSFRDLENRIAQQPTTKDVGDAFEIFVEAYLATQRIMQAEKVWPVGQIPFEIRSQMNLPANTTGVDGVFRTLSNELVPYQVKFRTLGQSLTYTEVATFLGLTERASDRVIFTNTRDVARDAKTRDAIRTVRVQDFCRLTPEDFSSIENWLKQKPVERPQRLPRPYQREAVERIIKTFGIGDRATAVMACGTGKTLVALWVAEQMLGRRILVFVPSLALLSQTLKEWSRWTTWGSNYRYLCVCSDPTVSHGIDDIRLDQIDADFPISTEPLKVRRFLQSSDSKTQVIFSTYQSSPVVSKGAFGLGPFDLAIFDEAHKTTGMQGSVFALPLLDSRIQVKKRLFLTATPRHYDIKHRDREGDFRVISMDNEKAFGSVAYRLTFAEAAKKNIICNYKIIVSIVDGKEITDFALSHGVTLVDGNEIAVRWVALQLALKKAIEKVRASRVITFHSTVTLAKRLASQSAEGVSRYLKGFTAFHVNGEQTSALREAQLNAFNEAPKGIITNARCLTEGVDVPAVDMVFFMNPRKSSVDIAQATGRAMRKAGPKKSFGYVVVPLFLNKHRGESIQQALKRSNFEDVADVLNSMQEQDTDLVDIIREMRESRGRLGRFKVGRLSKKLHVIGPRVFLDRLRSNIFVQVIDRLGLDWDEYFGRLIKYKKRYGDCNVPDKWEKDRSLAMWVGNQRQRKHREELSPIHIQRLDEIGFDWDPKETQWQHMYKELVEYKNRYGNCAVSQEPANLKLLNWVNSQRQFRNKNRLSIGRIKQLSELGFDWDPHSTAWDTIYARLVGYKKQHGNCNVPRSWAKDSALAEWVGNQRQYKVKGLLSRDRVLRLEELGFTWVPKESLWADMYTQLKEYKKRHGHCNVPDTWAEDQSLGMWVTNLRARKRRNHLSRDNIRQLDAIGFNWDWDSKEARWQEMYGRLRDYVKRYGNCLVPAKWEKDLALGAWVGNQRQFRARGRLSNERISLLDKLGFIWRPHHSLWDKMFKQLSAYKNQHGNCNIFLDEPKNASLRRWVITQRKLRTNKKLSDERENRLTRIGFSWNLNSPGHRGDEMVR